MLKKTGEDDFVTGASLKYYAGNPNREETKNDREI
jgi:hypothetical protein